jgi:uncharacterized protein YdhG (YjbR/CyaY superfamily)
LKFKAPLASNFTQLRPLQISNFKPDPVRDDVKPKNIDEYIASCSPEVQPVLQKIRATVSKAAPGAKEKISYGMPTFTLEGNLVHFAAFTAHIGFYPPVRGDQALMNEVSVYAGPKGNLRFPLDKRIPYGLIARIVKARVRENLQKAEDRRRKKPKLGQT